MHTFTEEIFISDVFIIIAARNSRKDHGQTYVNFSYGVETFLSGKLIRNQVKMYTSDTRC